MATYSTGEVSAKGTYQCTNCGKPVILDEKNDALPKCPNCGKTDFMKV